MIQPPNKIKEAREISDRALSGTHFGHETIRKHKDGTLINTYITAIPVVIDGETIGKIGVYQDITERKKMEKELENLARIDSLTGCYSRGYGLELSERLIKLAHRNKSSLLVTFIDIDALKDINDNYGHKEGDKVLVDSVVLFKSTLREIDIICRMGGDEFLLIFPNSSSKQIRSIKSRLERNLSQLNKSIEKDYQISFSMGFAEFNPDKPKTIEELINIADQRMYEDKKK
jgi:diguanylate cyclase (GGDEF)-like protein